MLFWYFSFGIGVMFVDSTYKCHWSIKQESIPVGCVPPACQPYVLQWPPLHVRTVGKPSSEQVWICLQWWPLDVSSRGVPRSHVWRVTPMFQCIMGWSHGDLRTTDNCENITLPQLPLRTLMTKIVSHRHLGLCNEITARPIVIDVLSNTYYVFIH